MFCKKCGLELKDSPYFCANCGAKADDAPREFGMEPVSSGDTIIYKSNDLPEFSVRHPQNQPVESFTNNTYAMQNDIQFGQQTFETDTQAVYSAELSQNSYPQYQSAQSSAITEPFAENKTDDNHEEAASVTFRDVFRLQTKSIAFLSAVLIASVYLISDVVFGCIGFNSHNMLVSVLSIINSSVSCLLLLPAVWIIYIVKPKSESVTGAKTALIMFKIYAITNLVRMCIVFVLAAISALSIATGGSGIDNDIVLVVGGRLCAFIITMVHAMIKSPSALIIAITGLTALISALIATWYNISVILMSNSISKGFAKSNTENLRGADSFVNLSVISAVMYTFAGVSTLIYQSDMLFNAISLFIGSVFHVAMALNAAHLANTVSSSVLSDDTAITEKESTCDNRQLYIQESCQPINKQ